MCCAGTNREGAHKEEVHLVKRPLNGNNNNINNNSNLKFYYVICSVTENFISISIGYGTAL